MTATRGWSIRLRLACFETGEKPRILFKKCFRRLGVRRYASTPRADTQFVDLFTNGTPITVHFVVWSIPAQELFGLAQYDATTVALVIIDPTTGHCVIIALVPNTTTGPLVASPSSLVLTAWLQGTSGQGRIFGHFDLSLSEFAVQQTFSDGQITAAAAPVTW